jgi:hypothetical protein
MEHHQEHDQENQVLYTQRMREGVTIRANAAASYP